MTANDAGPPQVSYPTHHVSNQPPPRTDVNEFTLNMPLNEYLRSLGESGSGAIGELEASGAVVGSAQFQDDARLVHKNPPVLHTHSKYGQRIDEVQYHPSYHRIISQAVAAGAHTSAWERPGIGANAARAAHFMLFAQVEPGHACPISMSHAAANTTRAVPDGEHFLLTGHKWFCSAPMSDAFLVLAQEDAGLGCFLVPRVLPCGAASGAAAEEHNPFMIQRLKDKAGNRSNASAEVEFLNTYGWRVGEPGRGVKAIMGMVSQTRLDCILGTAAGMRQSITAARLAPGWLISRP